MYTKFTIKLLNVRREDLESSEFRSILLLFSGVLFIFAAGVIVIIPDLIASDETDLFGFIIKGIIWAGCLPVIYLLRIKAFTSAKITLLTHINLMIYFLTIREGVLAGSPAFFIPIAMLALLIFNKDRIYKYIFFILPAILFLFGYLELTPIPQQYKLPEEAVPLHFFTRLLLAGAITFILGEYLQKLHIISEKRLKDKNYELQKANEELDKFVYSTSHDLKGPLKSILGLINLSEYHVKKHPELKHLLTMMKTRVTDLDYFIGDVATYSKNTNEEVTNKSINLRQFVTNQIENMSDIENISKVYFEIKIPEATDVVTDPMRLETVLNNLIYNAVKYQDQDKSSSFVKIDLIEKDNETCICIEDNGIGIANNIHHKIFDMFYRANENSSGSGLGLYLVKESIEKLGGKVTLTSSVGNGSQFFVYIPGITSAKSKTVKHPAVDRVELGLVSNA